MLRIWLIRKCEPVADGCVVVGNAFGDLGLWVSGTRPSVEHEVERVPATDGIAAER